MGGKIIVFLERKPGRSNLYKVTHFHLDKLSEDERLPRSDNYEVHKDEIFDSERVVLPGDYILLSYVEQPIDNGYNRYNHPMDERTYNHFLSKYLHSEIHKQMKEAWLWKAYANLHFSQPILTDIYYERFSRHRLTSSEQNVVQQDDPEKWTIWTMWRKKFLRSTRVAPELVFSSAYN